MEIKQEPQDRRNESTQQKPGEKLRLRPYRLGDAQKIVTWCANQEAFYKWSAGVLGVYPLTPAQFNQAISQAIAARNNGRSYLPLVAERQGEAVGCFILRQSGEEVDQLRFGFVILDPACRGKGCGKEMLRLGIEYAAHTLGAKKVTLGVFSNNPGAYYCYKSVGFTETGITKEGYIGEEIWTCIELELSI